MRSRVLPSLTSALFALALPAVLLIFPTPGIGGGEPPAIAPEDLETLKKANIKAEPAALLDQLRQYARKPGSLDAEVTGAVLQALLVHPSPDTGKVLLEFLEAVKEVGLREQGQSVFGQLTIRQGKADQILLDALQGTGERRKAAIHALARRGTAAHRALLRPLLEEKDTALRDFTSDCLAGRNPFRPVEAVEGQVKLDENLLRDFKVTPDERGLLEFFRQRTVTGNDEQQIKSWVRQLGDRLHRNREVASRQLLLRGPPVIKFLEAALDDPDQEIGQRARQCLERIAQGAGPALPLAAIRLLPGRVAPGLATRVLLDYIPFADDLQVEDEVLQSLHALTFRAAKLDPQLSTALNDSHPLRRSAAAYVLGKAGLEGDCRAVAKLLRDDDVRVRLRAAQGLLSARDPQAVNELVALYETIPQARLWAVEEPLFALAGENTPSLPANFQGDVRKKQGELWRTWWGKIGPTLDLARLAEEDRRLGLYTVSEYDSVNGQPGGRVWEMGRDGKQRWQITNLQGPMSVQHLPGGRVLVAENMNMRITERDMKGTVLWERKTNTFPIQATRLPGGNTFIATYHELFEIAPGGKEIYRHDFGRNNYIFSANKTRNGRIVLLTSLGVLKELDALTGKELRSLNLGHNGWGGVEALPGGRYLVALQNPGVVREIDSSGKILWSVNYQGAFRATRLPGGNVVVASMTTRRVAEFDRAGTMRWERTCNGRPWCIEYR